MTRFRQCQAACHRSIRCAPSRRRQVHGSATKAAAELSVTHGAVSHQIKALEATLKARLFERAGQRLS